MVIKILAVVAVAALAFFALRRFQAPKSRTRRLAITVWAAFGPYDTAQDADDGLRQASRVVFGGESITEHEEWIESHIKNFRDWQAEGRFHGAQKMMRTGLLLTGYGHAFEVACKKVKAEVVARGLEAMEALNKDFIEEGGHRLEAVKQPDGTLQFAYKQIWSDEEIRRKKKEDGEAIYNAIGKNLLEDQSREASKLLVFLGLVYQENMDKDLETPMDVGNAWLACSEVADKDPDSELARSFKELSDAWIATKSDRET